ncbi:alpha/beta hydrolase [Rhodococcus qingshengii]|uniref:alpha/beta hydrolase n=1 Tax=Rhodococcus qingshengii TaxID=334542 RepID=UPI0010A6B18B|nr:alpha/beta hydrolase [Rhodococcus qingshengii]THJ64678.1 alpha/beta hydrolase [Rhodococcus qingshengii]
MASEVAEKLDAELRAWTSSMVGASDPSVESLREGAEAMGTFGAERSDVVIDEVDMGGRRALKHTPQNVGDGVILHLHGGGLTMGSPESHSRLAAHMATRSKMTVYNLDFRLAPEHPFPAGIDDTAAAFERLVEQGVSPDRIFLSGDSGGAALALSTLIDLTRAGTRLAGGIFMSPWVDFRLVSGSYETNDEFDVMCSRPMMLPLRQNYCPSGDFENPRVSPALADLTGLPPLMIQASSMEVLLDDAKLIAQRAGDVGVEVTYEEYDVVPHVFQLFAGNLPEADDALQSCADWATKALTKGA